MNWDGYSDKKDRAANKVYEDVHITSWELNSGVDGALIPNGVSTLEEKSRLVEASNSNKYNITQSIAETFGIFCVYEYKTDSAGRFIKTYTEDGINKTGRCAVFYNKAIKQDNPLNLTYQHNLQSFSRTADTSELYTKLYVSAIDSDNMDTGYISIADADSNPLRDDFILNFDYLYSVGSITDLQKQQIEQYKVKLRAYNDELAALEEKISNDEVLLNEAKADATIAKEGVSSAHEQYVSYQTLAENEIYTTPVHKDVNNRYTGIFVPSAAEGIVKCTLKLDGVLAEGYDIRGYQDIEYSSTKTLFTYATLTKVSSVTAPADDSTFYAVIDEYGFLTDIYTSIKNTALGDNVITGAVVYLDLYYCPKNKYEKVMEKFQTLETINTAKQAEAEQEVKKLQELVDTNTAARDELLQKKEDLNNLFERQMGGALREGYWTPNSYDDIGSLVKINAHNNTSPFLWDSEAFDGEDEPYYYANAEDQGNDIKTYYPIVDLSEPLAAGVNITNTFPLYFTKVLSPYTTDQYFSGGPAKVMLDAMSYYFDLSGYSGANHVIKVEVDLAASPFVKVTIDGIALTVYTDDTVFGTKAPEVNDITARFEGLAGSLVTMKLYPNAGYIFGFIKETDGTIKPIALLNNDSIEYSRYITGKVYYESSVVEKTQITTGIQDYPTTATYVYPRIFIDYKNTNYNSDEFTIYKSTTAEEVVEDSREYLTKYTDYSVLLRDWKPYVNFKVTENCSVSEIFNDYFHVACRVSRANEQLYLDAKQVALDNSQPKYSYSITKANIPDEMEAVELGQLAYINDYSLSVYKVTGYISGVKYSLDDSSKDELTIQNYKTKFEDLFSTISASSEAMQVNKRSYDAAASSFSGGVLTSNVLQKSLAQSNVSFNFSKTKVTMDDTGGITLTNETPYTNGVYGQVALRGGGIYCSNSTDELGNRIWNSAITADGINAALITAGQLDTNKIRIYNGNNIAFQWNSEGLYAYDTNEEGQPDLNTYVRLSQDGLQYVSTGTTAVDLGWNGLQIAAQDGAVALSGSDGLTIYNSDSQKVAHLGKDGTTYGLQLYNGTDNNTLTFYNTNDGTLWLKSEMLVGGETSGTASGISGADTSSNDLRIWAGATSNSETAREKAPFRVYEDGSIYASHGQIGNLDIENLEDSLQSYKIRVESSQGTVFSTEATTVTVLTASLYKGESPASVPSGGTLTYQWCKKENGDWVAIEGANTSSYEITMTDKSSYCCKAVLTKGGN